MTKEQATALGYSLIKASICEVGLIKNGKGIRTWWASDFNGKMPELDHPKIMEAIEITEDWSR